MPECMSSLPQTNNLPEIRINTIMINSNFTITSFWNANLYAILNHDTYNGTIEVKNLNYQRRRASWFTKNES